MQGTVCERSAFAQRGRYAMEGSPMKLKLDKAWIIAGLVIAMSGASALWLATGSHPKFDEGLVKAVKKLQF
jgi:hypothetical protein